MLRLLYKLMTLHRAAAADDVLLEAARLGDDDERAAALTALHKRATPRGMTGLVATFGKLPAEARDAAVGPAPAKLATPLARCARSDDDSARASAAAYIAHARQPRLIHLLGELLRSASADVFDAAAHAALDLAAYAAGAGGAHETPGADADEDTAVIDSNVADREALRHEIALVVVRALDHSRGRESAVLARAAITLMSCGSGPVMDAWRRHGSRGWPLVKARLAHPPDAEATAAVLACAARNALRGDTAEALGVVVEGIERPAMRSALLARTHWLLDPKLAQQVKEAGHGTAAPAAALRALGSQADPPSAAQVRALVRWGLASGGHLLEDAVEHLFDTAPMPPVRLALLEALAGAGADSSSTVLRLLERLVRDEDERIARMAARVLARSESQEAQRSLVRQAPEAPASVRRVISRALAGRSFASLWSRFDALPPQAAADATPALLKLIPDLPERLARRMLAGPGPQRIKALRMAERMNVLPQTRHAVLGCCGHEDPRIRSKAVSMLDRLLAEDDGAADSALEAALVDGDPRVRANAVEVLERSSRRELLPLLESRSRLGRNRERANAIRAIWSLKLADVDDPLFQMLRDKREPHRLSGLWAVEQTGRWKLLDEVVRLARRDSSVRVRRSAMGAVRRVAAKMRVAA